MSITREAHTRNSELFRLEDPYLCGAKKGNGSPLVKTVI